MTTITTEKIEELRELAKDKFADFRMSIKPAEAFALLDLAQRAMVEYGPADDRGPTVVALPQDAIQPPDGKSFVEWALPESEYVPDFGLAVHEDEVKQYGQECYDAGRASQQPQEGQALPELPDAPLLGVGQDGLDIYGFTANQVQEYARAYASQLALPAGPVPEGELKEILGDLWDEGYVSPATYNDVDIRDPEERQRMRDHNVSEAQRRIAAALSAPASPAVAQPVADERAVLDEAEIMEIARECEDEYCFPINHKQFARKLLARAALCPPAKEGDKA